MTALWVLLILWQLIEFIQKIVTNTPIFGPSSSNLTVAQYVDLNILFVIITFPIIYVLDLIKRLLFPRILIPLGKQANKPKMLNFWRYFIFVTIGLFIVSCLIGQRI